MEEFEISVVMPCLNEAKTVGELCRQGTPGIAALGVRGEVVIADNGSHDGSQQIAHDHGARVIDVAKRGYGHALRRHSRRPRAIHHHGRLGRFL